MFVFTIVFTRTMLKVTSFSVIKLSRCYPYSKDPPKVSRMQHNIMRVCVFLCKKSINIWIPLLVCLISITLYFGRENFSGGGWNLRLAFIVAKEVIIIESIAPSAGHTAHMHVTTNVSAVIKLDLIAAESGRLTFKMEQGFKVCKKYGIDKVIYS